MSIDHFRPVSFAIAFSAIALVITVATVPVLAQSTAIVAVNGQSAPDGNGIYFTFNNPVLNDAGHAAFYATLAGTSGGTSDDRALIVGDGIGASFVLAREGQIVANGNGRIIGFSGLVFINDAGQAALRATLDQTTGGFSDNFGIFLADPTAGVLDIAREGQLAPDGNGTFTASFGGNLNLNNLGEVGFDASLTGTTGGPTDNDGLFLGGGTAGLRQVARQGQSAPGGIGFYGQLGAADPVLNNAGHAGFQTTLVGTSNPPFDDEAIFLRNPSGGLALVVRSGQAAPDGNGNYFIFGFASPALNNLGQVAFEATLTGTSGGSTDNEGIFFYDTTGVISQIARTGQAAPDGNGTFSEFQSPMINDAGQVAFHAQFTGTTGGSSDSRAYFVGDSVTGLTQFARTGQFEADLGGRFSSLSFLAFNDAGQAAFLANFVDGVTGATEPGLFFYDPSLGLLQVALRGDAFLGSTVVGLEFEGGLVDEGSGLNNHGQMAYRFTLDDGTSGIAIWTVPEPGSMATLAVVAGLVFRHRRH